ncbi:MAG TPA: adenylosuccinate lyase [Candidatus Polarisedimenticolaceae bacterium]|nr:adenylosuccinate lyase [Candidatus Polarisedimenticolaceae bacterium]
MQGDYSSYNSPLGYRYASPEMRELFSEATKYKLWRRVWVALAKTQHEAGLITDEELADLEANQDTIDIKRILEIEADTKHDVVAAIREFAEKAKVGGGKIHLGATSMDVNDNADAMRVKQALELIEERVKALLKVVAAQAGKYAETPCLGYTHLQPAEPTTIGYRLAFYGDDLLSDLQRIQGLHYRFVGKGMKGAIGTRASYTAILEGTDMSAADLDEKVMAQLHLRPALISTQVLSRKQDYDILSALAGIGGSLAKMAADVRLLQSPGFGEWSEPFAKNQVGSSAMPFKKNPITAEKICSLARQLAQLPSVALENAAHSYLERTLDDSANRRMITPEAFLLADEILLSATKLVEGLVVNEKRVADNLAQFGPFAATEVLIIEAVKQGADRQEMHELLRTIALEAWQQPEPGKAMVELLKDNSDLGKHVSSKRLDELLDVRAHLGDAPNRVKQLVNLIDEELA